MPLRIIPVIQKLMQKKETEWILDSEVKGKLNRKILRFLSITNKRLNKFAFTNVREQVHCYKISQDKCRLLSVTREKIFNLAAFLNRHDYSQQRIWITIIPSLMTCFKELFKEQLIFFHSPFWCWPNHRQSPINKKSDVIRILIQLIYKKILWKKHSVNFEWQKW